jgi:hypothetical protein
MRPAAVTCQSRHEDMRVDIEQVSAAQAFGAESQATVRSNKGIGSSASRVAENTPRIQ